MRTFRRTAGGLAAMLLALTSPWANAASAQGTAVLDSGVVAYEDVSYDAAARLLRRALAVRGADSLGLAHQVMALSYLGATEYYRHQPDSAAAAFRRLIARAPYQQLDSLVFASPVSAYFNDVRRALHAVVMARSLGDSVEVLVLPLVAHHATVDVRALTGARVATLYDGMVRDSLHLGWGGRGPDGTRVPPGAYELVAATRTADEGASREARFTVMLARAGPVDASHAPWPMRVRTPPERRPPLVAPGGRVAPALVSPPVATVRTRRDDGSWMSGHVSGVRLETGVAPADVAWAGWTTGISARLRRGRVSMETDYAEGWLRGTAFIPDTTTRLVIIGPAPTGSSSVERRRVAEGAVTALVAPTEWLAVGGGPQVRAVAGTPAERWLYWNVTLRLRVPFASAAASTLRLDRAVGGRAGRADALRSGTRGELEVALGRPERRWQLLLATGAQRGRARTPAGIQGEQHVRLGVRLRLP